MAGIKVTIDKETLAIKIEAEGMGGTGCTQVVDDFQSILGATTTEQTLKPEYKTVTQRIPVRR